MVTARINTMTGCFRLSGFSRRYFRHTRELVNSRSRSWFSFTVCGGGESRMHVLKARRNKPADSRISSPPPSLLPFSVSFSLNPPTSSLLSFSLRVPLLCPSFVHEPPVMARSELVAHARAMYVHVHAYIT